MDAAELRARIKALHACIKTLRAEIEEREIELHKITGKLVDEALAVLPEDRRPEEPVIGDWECKRDPENEPEADDDADEDEEPFTYRENPAGFCIYDDDADPCHDFCLFCGQPEERK